MRLAELVRTSSFRTGLLFMGLFGCGSVALFGTIYAEMTAFLERQSEDWLYREVAARLRNTPAERTRHLNASLSVDPDEHRPVTLFGADGHVAAGRIARRPAPPAFDRPFLYATVTSSGRPVTYRMMEHRLHSGQTLVVGQDVGVAEGVSGPVIHAIAVGGAAMLVLGLAGAVLLARGTTRHIDAMRRAIERIVAGDLSERLPPGRGSTDLDRLAGVVNAMLDELERTVGEVKSVCDNIAHDMRTPLARMLAGLERVQRRGGGAAELRDAIDTAVAETKDILRIFAALLRISEIEHGGRRAGFERIDLATVAADAFEYHQPAAEARRLRIDFDAPRHLTLDGDPGLLFEAIGNLLDNAIKFAGDGGRVTLALAAGPVIRVSDDGPGIPDAEREAVLRRFERGAASRTLPGSGLGLPLVDAIARLHGLALTIGDASPGCTVTLAPAAAARPVRNACPTSRHPAGPRRRPGAPADTSSRISCMTCFPFRHLAVGALALLATARAPAAPHVLRYLPAADVDPILTLPRPPASGSATERDELAALHRIIAAATPARLAQARWDDAHEDAALFDAALGLRLEAMPVTWALLRDVQAEGDAAAELAKVRFDRRRPWAVDPTLPRCDAGGTANPGHSYPSGHATLAYSTGFVLAHLLPGKANAILARAADYAMSREVCGVHFPFDTEASHVLGTLVASRMLALPALAPRLAAARAELAAAGADRS